MVLLGSGLWWIVSFPNLTQRGTESVYKPLPGSHLFILKASVFSVYFAFSLERQAIKVISGISMNRAAKMLKPLKPLYP